jgi:hypothetical protein
VTICCSRRTLLRGVNYSVNQHNKTMPVNGTPLPQIVGFEVLTAVIEYFCLLGYNAV